MVSLISSRDCMRLPIRRPAPGDCVRLSPLGTIVTPNPRGGDLLCQYDQIPISLGYPSVRPPQLASVTSMRGEQAIAKP